MNARPEEPTFGFVVNDVARLLRKRFEQRVREAGLDLTRAQWSVLVHLARNAGIRQGALAQLLEIEPITLVRILDRLQVAGLVERRADPSDRRAWTLWLTPSAEEPLAKLRELGAQTRVEALRGLDAAEQQKLMDMLLTVKTNLSQSLAGVAEGDGHG